MPAAVSEPAGRICSLLRVLHSLRLRAGSAGKQLWDKR